MSFRFKKTFDNQSHYIKQCVVDGQVYSPSEYIIRWEDDKTDNDYIVEKIISTETGEYLAEKRFNKRVLHNFKINTHNRTFNVAYNKGDSTLNINALKLKVSDLLSALKCDGLRGMLQASTGKTHYEREVVVLDVDDESRSEVEMITYILNICKTYDLPLPSTIQFNLSNQHTQCHWYLTTPLSTHTISTALIQNKKWLIPERTEDWYRYRDLYKGMAILFGGDLYFTGWQMKNPFYRGSNKSNYKTYFLNSLTQTYTTTEPANIVQTSSDQLYKQIKHTFLSHRDQLNLLYNNITWPQTKGTYHQIPTYNSYLAACNKNLSFLNDLSYNQAKDEEDAEYDDFSIEVVDKNYAYEGVYRNGFLIKDVARVIRESDGRISREDLQKKVWVDVQNFEKSNIEKGHTYDHEFTYDQFLRSSSSAYNFFLSTYKSHYSSYTDEQRQKSIETKKIKKYTSMIILMYQMIKHKNLAKNNHSSNKKLSQLMAYKVTADTIRNYKKELGIDGKIKKKHLQKIKHLFEVRGMWFNRMWDYYTKLKTSNRRRVDGWNSRINQTNLKQEIINFFKTLFEKLSQINALPPLTYNLLPSPTYLSATLTLPPPLLSI